MHDSTTRPTRLDKTDALKLPQPRSVFQETHNDCSTIVDNPHRVFFTKPTQAPSKVPEKHSSVFLDNATVCGTTGTLRSCNHTAHCTAMHLCQLANYIYIHRLCGY